jgi:quinol monooxygenase YgiN
MLPPSPVQLYKAVGCLRYQCSEGEAIKHPLYAVLTELYNNIAHYIVTRTTEYEKAQWG